MDQREKSVKSMQVPHLFFFFFLVSHLSKITLSDVQGISEFHIKLQNI